MLLKLAMSKPARPSMKSSPPLPVKVLLLASPRRVSANIEPWTALTPVKVSLPTEASPLAVPAAMSTLTPAVALLKLMRVLPLPMMVSLPPPPVNSLKVPSDPALALVPLKPVAS
jgi:hypothetical protein